MDERSYFMKIIIETARRHLCDGNGYTAFSEDKWGSKTGMYAYGDSIREVVQNYKSKYPEHACLEIENRVGRRG